MKKKKKNKKINADDLRSQKLGNRLFKNGDSFFSAIIFSPLSRNLFKKIQNGSFAGKRVTNF